MSTRRTFIRSLVGGALASEMKPAMARLRGASVQKPGIGETRKRETLNQQFPNWEQLVKKHPAGDTLKRLFPGAAPPEDPAFHPTGLRRDDYLKLIAGVVGFFLKHQNADGAIIDPYVHAEKQYSTPAFALAGAILVAHAGRKDLLEPASRALTFSIRALANRTTADFHADFYIPMVIHARRLLKDSVEAPALEEWTRLLNGLVPEKTYRDHGGGGNWNIVNVSGELLRRQDGLVAPELRAGQDAYLERCLQTQQDRFTHFGMYEDPNSPLAYDAFPRLWLEDVAGNNAYDGTHAAELAEFLALGGLSTLLLLSPSGEWACGGRSAHHQWNEAEVAVIAEVNANRWKARGRQDLAGAFKRAAHLALTSMNRWQRPSGELWIIKNHGDPAARHGFEGYSFHSQYNLLPMEMLALAYLHADDTIPEQPIPSEYASYLFDVRETFHKIAAAAGGSYVLIDTGADPHYNATGLMRFHSRLASLSPLSDNAPPHRFYGPNTPPKDIPLAPGISWQDTPGGPWQSLADYVSGQYKSHTGTVTGCDLNAVRAGGSGCSFHLIYTLSTGHSVEEDYHLDAGGVTCASRIIGNAHATRVVFPALVSDAAKELPVKVTGEGMTVEFEGNQLTWTVEDVPNLRLEGPRIPVHNGFVRALVGDLPEGARQVKYHLSLAPLPD